jgi:hypothetical protein
MSILIICGLTALQVAAQENSWKTEIDNSLVRVARRLVAPHETVSAAEMPPALLVFLTDFSVRVTGAAPQELRGKPGQFIWHPGGRIGLENLSEHRVEVARVTPKFSPASEEASAARNSRNVIFDNDLIRVRRIHFARGGKAAMHPVPPYVVIHLSAAHLKFTQADGRVEDFQMKAGNIRFQPRAAYSGENLGDSLEVLRIDLKAGNRDRP